MANSSPQLENLRPPWPKGTSGNPAGYSRGRRISDVIKTQIEELGLTEEFAASAITTALGYKQILKKNVQDPETGEDIWIELKPDIAWFKLILKLVEPAAQKPDDMGVLNALRAEYERARRAEAEKGNASVVPERWWCDPVHREEKVELAGKPCQGATAPAGSGQVAPEARQPLPRAADPVTNAAVKTRFDKCCVPIWHGLVELLHQAQHAVQLVAFLAAQLGGLFTGGIRRFLYGNIRIRPRSGHGLSGALGAIGVVAFFMLSYQTVVLDHQGACVHVVRQAAVVADQQDGSRVVHQERLEQLQGLDAEVTPPTPPSQGGEKTSRPNSPPPLAKGGLGGVAGWTFGAGNASENRSNMREVVAQQADDPPATLLTRLTLSVLSPVLAPKGDPDGKPIAGT